MSQIVDLFDHERVLPIQGMGTLLGDPKTTELDGLTGPWSSFAAGAAEVGEASISSIAVAEFEIRVGEDAFVVPIVPWSRLPTQSSGIALQNNTSVRAYRRGDGPDKYILVGRSDAGIPMMQQGSGYDPGAGNHRVSLWITELDGGLIDRMIHGTGQRHLLVMQCDQDAEPADPPHGTDLRYHGQEPIASSLSSGEVWYPSGNRGRSSSVKTWFAFGETVYDNLNGLWRTQSAWHKFDQADRANIRFGRNWDGPWEDGNYVVGAHRYARWRYADGSFAIRYIGTDGGDHHREWVPLTEQYVNASAYRSQPYTARTAFNFDPSEWRWLRWEWEWDGYEGEIASLGTTYQDRVEAVIAAASIVPSVQQTRTTAWATRYHGAVWNLRAQRALEGMQVSRTPAGTLQGGWAGDLRMAVQFETSDPASVAPPITHIRFVERGQGSTSANGWLRTFVL